MPEPDRPVGTDNLETIHVPVYVIGGTSRSGSTLLASLLAQATQGFDCGEIHLLWRSFDDGRLCTCGAPISSCDVWGQVAERVLSTLQLSDPAAAAAIQESEGRQRRLLSPYVPAPSSNLLNLYRVTASAVSMITGAKALIDNSKLPLHARTVLLAHPYTSVVHLVRDPRAVAYSMSTPKADPSTHGSLMPSCNSIGAAASWVVVNLGMERVRRRWPTKVQQLRYEDLAESPTAALTALVGRGGLTPLYPSNDTLASHAIAGNPSRFALPQTVDRDDRWVNSMVGWPRRVVDFMTWPQRRLYRYH